MTVQAPVRPAGALLTSRVHRWPCSEKQRTGPEDRTTGGQGFTKGPSLLSQGPVLPRDCPGHLLRRGPAGLTPEQLENSSVGKGAADTPGWPGWLWSIQGTKFHRVASRRPGLSGPQNPGPHSLWGDLRSSVGTGFGDGMCSSGHTPHPVCRGKLRGRTWPWLEPGAWQMLGGRSERH